MYRWLFNRVPGPAWLRALVLAAVAAGLVVALFRWGFPAVEPLLPFGQSGLEEG